MVFTYQGPGLDPGAYRGARAGRLKEGVLPAQDELRGQCVEFVRPGLTQSLLTGGSRGKLG